MNFITLRNGYNIPSIGLGTFTLFDIKLFDRAIQCGYRLFDTAAKYNNEKQIGKCLSANEGESSVISKINSAQYNGRRRYFYLNKSSIKSCYKRSSDNLCKRGPDILLLHSLFPNYIEAYKDMISLYNEGVIRAIGICNCDNISTLCKIKDECGVFPMINQIEIHPYYAQHAMARFCQEHGITIIARSPFAHGLILKLLEKDIGDLCYKYNKTLPQIILRWIVQKGMIAIPRSSNEFHMKENLNIFDFYMDESDMQRMDTLDRNFSFGCI